MLTLYNSLLGSYNGEEENLGETSATTSSSSLSSSISSFIASPAKSSDDTRNFSEPINHVEAADLNSPEVCKQILVYLLQESSAQRKDIDTLKKENQVLRESNDDLCCKTLKIIKFVKSVKKSVETTNEKIAVLENQCNENYDELSSSINDMKISLRDLEQVAGESSVFSSSVDESRNADTTSDAPPDIVEDSSTERLAALEQELKDLEVKSVRNETELQTVKDICHGNNTNIHALKNDMIRLDTAVIATNQYNRRENLIIDGIPEQIKGKKLEDACIEIVKEMGFFALSRYEVIACHRLKRKDATGPRPTIIRFFNRKIVEHCIKNRNNIKHLSCKSWDIGFREDLSEANQAIFDHCAVLKSQGELQNFYTKNGFVKLTKIGETQSIKITHSVDLLKHFPAYYNNFYNGSAVPNNLDHS